MTTQPNTEPLKVGEKVTFEQMNPLQRRLHNAACVLDADGDEYGYVNLLRETIAELTRTEPSPAELPERIGYSTLMQMASDAGLGPAHVSGVIQVRLEKFGRAVEQYARQALSQQSPARVEGELTDEDIWALADDYGVLETYNTEEILQFARALRALNQRLAVKEGEAAAVEWRRLAHQFDRQRMALKSTLAILKLALDADDEMPDGQTMHDFIDAALNASPSAHPVSDDQQAKDAALSFQPIQVNIGVKNGEN